MSDLRRWRDRTPQATAVMAYGAGGEARSITYTELAGWVERFAGALYELGVRPGQVVACQLPNWWQTHALQLAATRLQAVLAPITTTMRPLELQRMLQRVGARVCITVDEWEGFEHAAALRAIAPALPELRHRVVIGEATHGDVDFRSAFEQPPWEQHHPVALDDAVEDPDRIAMVLFTSGTSGEPRGALHTQNTLYASASSVSQVHDFGAEDVRFTPHALMHIVGQDAARSAVIAGASVVLLDAWSGQRGLEVLADSAVTGLVAAPSFVYDMLAAMEERPVHLPALRTVRCVGATIPAPLIEAVPATFGARLLSGWDSTEIGTGSVTRGDDPPNWAAYSDGRPINGMQLDIRSDAEITGQGPGRLFARGGAVCLATTGRDTGDVTVTADHDDGWYDTGDLAVSDGPGGIRLMGRVSDRIGGVFVIPLRDVESELLMNPRVDDVVLVGYPDEDGCESPCAVIVPATAPPITLDELRLHLAGQDMTEWYLPTRLEYVESLPRNDDGKVRKDLLRRWLVGRASLLD
jgi:cyclohexanecarboxylate-CoA ligase